MHPDISVIIPHYNDVENLSKCIRALTSQTLNRSRFELIVSDNNSTIGIEAIQSICGPDAIVVSEIEQGAGPTRNAGAAVAKGRILAFTDADCIPDASWLENGIAALTQYDILGGTINVSSENTNNRTDVECYESVFAFNNKRYVDRLGYTVTANLFTRRDVFDAVGGFRNNVSEDVEWCNRAAKSGFILGYSDDVIVSHPARRTWNELKGKWRRITRETFLLNSEQGRGTFRWFLRSCAILFSPLFHWVLVLRSDVLRTNSERISAIKILVKIRTWRFFECIYVTMRPRTPIKTESHST